MDLSERLAGPTRGLEGFQNRLQQESPTVQRMANDILKLVERTDADPFQIISQLTNDPGYRGDTGGSILGNLGRSRYSPIQEDRAESLEELLADPEAQMWTPVSPDTLVELFRILG